MGVLPSLAFRASRCSAIRPRLENAAGRGRLGSGWKVAGQSVSMGRKAPGAGEPRRIRLGTGAVFPEFPALDHQRQ